jgi:hypothetical protein
MNQGSSGSWCWSALNMEGQMSDDGKCGAKTYNGFTQDKINATLNALRANGAVVTGQNPWDVDTNNHGVKLQGTWDAAAGTLTVIVTDKAFYVPCSSIWSRLDELLQHIGGLPDHEVPSQ